MTSSSSSATEREFNRRREGEQALENARGLMTSVAGNDTDSLNNWRESATLRPIPAALFWGVREREEGEGEESGEDNGLGGVEGRLDKGLDGRRGEDGNVRTGRVE